MKMDDREQFKFGFLAACADAGLSIDETRNRVKLAIDLCGKSAGTSLVKAACQQKQALLPELLRASGTTLSAGLAGAGVLGAGGGYLAAKMTEQDIDPDEAKNQELIAAYTQMADRARRAMQMRRYRLSQAPTAPSLRLH